MDKKFKIINILLIVNIIIITLIFIYFYTSNMGAAGYRVQIANVFLIMPIINVLLIVINRIKKVNYRIKILLICIFAIISLVYPMYKQETFYIPEGANSHLMGIANKMEMFNIYGIKIFEKK